MKTHQMPVFKPARRKRLHEEIVGQIRSLIEEGELKSGDKLPAERRLAELFGVSRHCLREAIRALEQQRIVTCRLGDGTYVLSGSEENLIEPFAEIIEQRREKLREILELRRLIEPQIASLAAVNATEADIEMLRGALARHRGEIERGGTGSEEDGEFHLLIARATRNSVLEEMLVRLHDILSESRDFTLQTPRRRQWAIMTHERIMRALELRDAQLAFREMHEHILRVEELFLEWVHLEERP